LLPNRGPAGNPAVDAGVLVTVFGSNFVNSPLVSCRFGSMVVFATFSTATEVSCVAPARDVGGVAVEISENRQDFTTSGIGFTYQRTDLLSS
jgi:hypothetical protein